MSCLNLFTNAIDSNQIDKQVSNIINEVGLNKNNNQFFSLSHDFKKININEAFNVAYNWREITKTFLFSTIRGLGYLAEKIEKDNSQNLKLLSILQTTFNIISDDLSNNHPLLKAGAPPGPRGIHYKWWEETILNPLNQYLNIQVNDFSHGTKFLIQMMKKISTNYLGVTVQLRVVEAIALDICESFLALFSNVEHEGKNIFTKQDLIWITSHIHAEKSHHEQVRDTFSGMTGIVTSYEEQEMLLIITREYAAAWKVALDDFAKFIKIS